MSQLSHRQAPPQSMDDDEMPKPGTPLTATERQVVEALASGLAPKQIAYEYGRSVATIRSHLQRAKRKTGARTLPHLAAMSVHDDWPADHV